MWLLLRLSGLSEDPVCFYNFKKWFFFFAFVDWDHSESPLQSLRYLFLSHPPPYSFPGQMSQKPIMWVAQFHFTILGSVTATFYYYLLTTKSPVNQFRPSPSEIFFYIACVSELSCFLPQRTATHRVHSQTSTCVWRSPRVSSAQSNSIISVLARDPHCPSRGRTEV